jgi:hypothetical protein
MGRVSVVSSDSARAQSTHSGTASCSDGRKRAVISVSFMRKKGNEEKDIGDARIGVARKRGKRVRAGWQRLRRGWERGGIARNPGNGGTGVWGGKSSAHLRLAFSSADLSSTDGDFLRAAGMVGRDGYMRESRKTGDGRMGEQLRDAGGGERDGREPTRVK